MRMRSIQLLLASFLCWISVAQANILKGFATKEVPELEAIPNIAEEVRRLSVNGLLGDSGGDVSSHDRTLKSKKKKEAEEEQQAADDVTGRQNRNTDDAEREFPFIPEAPPEFDPNGELSFVIVSTCTMSIASTTVELMSMTNRISNTFAR